MESPHFQSWTRIGTMNRRWFGVPPSGGLTCEDRLKPGLQTGGSWKGKRIALPAETTNATFIGIAS